MKLLQKKGASLAAALLIFGISSPTSKGALTLNIDTTTQTFYFSGTDIIDLRVAPEFSPNAGMPRPNTWQWQDPTFPSQTSQQIDVVGAQASDLLSVALADTDRVRLSFATSFGFFDVRLNTSGYDMNFTTTVTGGGSTNIASYSSFLPNNIAVLEDLDGVVMDALFSGSNNMVVNVFASVPEPSSTALLGLGGLALMLRRRR